MTQLQRWMTKHSKGDAEVAATIKRSRSQISRLRRGITGASVNTALKLQGLTGIAWHHFVRGGQ
jgi:plasmid maintenance system antidote protein VapI